MGRVKFWIDVDEEDVAYFDTCARLRDICLRSLYRRLYKTIAQDQLVGAILDDGDGMRRREKGEHRYRGGRPNEVVRSHRRALG